MNITVQDAGSCLKKISVEIPATDVDKKLADEFKDLARQVNLPGFRPGKAPRAILEKKFGGHVLTNTRQQLVEEALRKASRDHDIEFVSSPDEGELKDIPNVAKGQALTFDLTIEVKPDFELPAYKGMEADSHAVTVSEKEVNIFLRNVQFSQGQLNDLKEGETSVNGDVLVGDFHVYVGEERIAGRPGGSLEIGSDTILGMPISDAETAFVGMTPSEEPQVKIFELEIPVGFPLEKYIGQQARVEVHVRQLLRPEVTDLTDESAKELGFEDLAALRIHAEEVIRNEKQHQAETDLENRLMDSVMELVTFTIPQKMAERQLSDVLSREAFRLYQEGMEDKQIEEFIEKRRTELPATIEREIRERFVIDAIAKKERLFVTEEEIARYVTNIAIQRQVPPQQLMDYFVENGMLPSIRWDLRSRKVRHLLRKKAKVNVIGGEAEKAEPSESAAEAAAE